MANFNAADIVGKSLIAIKTINILRIPADNANVVFKVNPGNSVGTVYSYLLPNNNRDSIYWLFYDENQKAYYAKHKPGIFDISTIKNQGVLTSEDKAEQAAAAAETTKDKIFKYIKNGFLVAAAVYLAKTFIETKKK